MGKEDRAFGVFGCRPAVGRWIDLKMEMQLEANKKRQKDIMIAQRKYSRRNDTLSDVWFDKNTLGSES